MNFSNLLTWKQRIFNSKWQVRLLMLFSGALYPLAFAPFELWGAAFVSVAILLYSMLQLTTCTTSAFKLAYYWGLGAFLFGASWVYVSIHEFGFVPVVGALLLTLLFAAYLALFKGVFGYLCQQAMQRSQQSILLLVAPAAWIITEYLQSIVFNGFPWLLIGYSQIDSPLASLATWFGVYGVGWFSVALSGCLALALTQKTRKISVMISAVLCAIVIVANVSDKQQNTTNNSAKTLDIALVQPNVPQQHKWDRKYFASIVDTLFAETEPLWDADFIIWPEGAIPAYAHQVSDILQDLSTQAISHDAHLLLGIPEYQSDSQRSFVSLLALGEKKQTYHKQVLVPFGEYVPMEQWLRGIIDFLDLPMSGFTPARTPQQPMQFKQVNIIPAICYEIVYPSILRDLSLQADQRLPQLIVTVSNDAWFGDSFGPYQHMQMARMRALELGIPLIRATNDGITATVDLHGEITEQLPRYQQSSLVKNISLANRSTLFKRWGNTGVLIILVLSCGFIGWSIFRHRQI